MGLLKTLKEDSRYDFWAAPRLLNKETVVMVPPGNQILFEKMMKVNGFDYSVLIKNVGRLVFWYFATTRSRRPNRTLKNIFAKAFKHTLQHQENFSINFTSP